MIIWEYGGIYSNMDSSPNKFNVDSIENEDDAFFPINELGMPAQYWFAASPRHAVMYFRAKHLLQTMAFGDDILNNNATGTTGSESFKTGFTLFQQMKGIQTGGNAEGALYEGMHNRSVKLVGLNGDSKKLIIREGVKAHFDATK